MFYQAWGAARYRWPRPFEKGLEYDLVDEDDSDVPFEESSAESEEELAGDWPVAWLPEILNGQVMLLREYMKHLENGENTLTPTPLPHRERG